MLVDECDPSLYLLPLATMVVHVNSHMNTTDYSDWPEKAKQLHLYLNI